MPPFDKRYPGSELMDDPDVSPMMLEAALRELPHINAWLGGYRATLTTLDRYWAHRHPCELRILDVGAGIGDYAFEIVKWGRRRGVKIHVTAVDINPTTVRLAVDAADRQPADIRRCVEFQEGDALDLEVQRGAFDICTCALFLHHMNDSQGTQTIRQMSRVATEGIIINDIHRHALAYYGTRLFTTILPFSTMVRHDAPVSVVRAFTRAEIRGLAEAAGLKEWTLNWRWAFRWILTSLPQG
jgi:2-polyprenyl-3-methyl-5-hydroxy-6-metoxy-1,4-benzoquinol methylase